jgi:hypothetical protein
MPKTLIIFTLLLMGGCATSTDMHLPVRADLSGIRRIGVLPFSDSRGHGRAYATAVSKGIYSLQVDIVPPEHIEYAFAQLELPEGEPIGIHGMLELSRLTQADAFVFGSVDCRNRGRRQVTVLMLSARGGETLLRSHFAHKKCGSREGVGLISTLITRAFAKAFTRTGLKDEVENGSFLR